jgi:hypothetical protein
MFYLASEKICENILTLDIKMIFFSHIHYIRDMRRLMNSQTKTYYIILYVTYANWLTGRMHLSQLEIKNQRPFLAYYQAQMHFEKRNEKSWNCSVFQFPFRSAYKHCRVLVYILTMKMYVSFQLGVFFFYVKGIWAPCAPICVYVHINL